MPSNSLSIIIVNYKSDHILEKCIASFLKSLNNIDFEIIVVNNDNSDISFLKNISNNIKIINNESNLGFGAGANRGAKIAKGEILFFLNPDSHFFSGNIQDILNHFREKPKAALLGCQILTEQKKVQKWSAGKEISLWNLILNNLGLTQDRRIWQSKKPIIAEWVTGTAVFAKKESFQEIGGFDEKFFMYFEDMDLSRRMRLAGKEVWHFPSFSVIHSGGKSYSDRSSQKKDYYRSQIYYFKKHRPKLEYYLIKTIQKIFY